MSNSLGYVTENSVTQNTFPNYAVQLMQRKNEREKPEKEVRKKGIKEIRNPNKKNNNIFAQRGEKKDIKQIYGHGKNI